MIAISEIAVIDFCSFMPIRPIYYYSLILIVIIYIFVFDFVVLHALIIRST